MAGKVRVQARAEQCWSGESVHTGDHQATGFVYRTRCSALGAVGVAAGEDLGCYRCGHMTPDSWYRCVRARPEGKSVRGCGGLSAELLPLPGTGSGHHVHVMRSQNFDFPRDLQRNRRTETARTARPVEQPVCRQPEWGLVICQNREVRCRVANSGDTCGTCGCK